MLNWIKNLFINNDNSEILEWKTDASIYKFITDNLTEEYRLIDSAIDLPDEKPTAENELRWAPGLLDSMFGPQDSEESKLIIEELAKLLKHISVYGDKRSEARFYQLITETDSIITIIDDLLERATNLSLAVNPYLFEFAKAMAFKTAHRNSVKVGVALIGICRGTNVIQQIKTIALHDEFTVFAIVAISNMTDNVVNDLWEIAKKVDGWGKIQVVDRLAKMELPDEIKTWLITEGYKNSIMYEELAYTCAVNGELHNTLKQENVDNKIFKASADIIGALIAGGPAEDFSDYQYASVVVENFVRHAKTKANDIFHFVVLNHLKDFLIELQNDLDEQSKNGWTQDIISNCLIDIVDILNSKDWLSMAMEALNSNDNITYWNAKMAAKILDIDIWEIVWHKLKDNPHEISLWYDVTHEAKPENIEEVIQLAINTFPLNEIATGPSNLLGLGLNYSKYQSFDNVITLLENYPAKGEPIVLAALDSPVTRNRNMAIKTLHKWGKQNWSQNLSLKLEELSKVEPDDNTKKNIFRVLNGEDLDY
ncbi:hypothetical protein GCM10027049_18540 [Mucilaginibacter puniceus]